MGPMKQLHYFISALCLIISLSFSSSAETPRKFVPNLTSVVIAAGDESVAVEDGDSFWLGAFRIRLEGIDAVEPGQNCSTSSGQQCSDAARDFLAEILKKNRVTCTFVLAKEGRPRINYGRYVSRCSIGGVEDEINRLMLSSGMAFTAEKGAEPEYESIVSIARSKQLGVHSVADLQHPAAFRRSGREPSRRSDSELIAEISKRWSTLSAKLKDTLRALFTVQEKP